MSALTGVRPRHQKRDDGLNEKRAFSEDFDVEILPTLADTMKDVLHNGSRADRLWVSTVFMLGGEGSKDFIKEFSTTCGVLSTLLLTVAISGIHSPPEAREEGDGYDSVGHILLWQRVYYTIEVLTVTFSLLGAAIPTLSFLYVGMLRNNDRDVAYFLSKFNYLIFVGNLLPLFLSFLGVISAMFVRLYITIGGTPLIFGGCALVISVVVGLSVYKRLDDSMHHMHHVIRVDSDFDFGEGEVVSRKQWPASKLLQLPV